MTDCAILNTSRLLELYQVPRDSKKARHEIVLRLQKQKQTVQVLAFDEQLEAYSG